MTTRAELEAALAGTPLLPGLKAAEQVFERRADDLAALALEPELVRGLARMLACNADLARYVSLRPALIRALAGEPDLGARGEGLDSASPGSYETDLENFIDALRLFRRDETAWAACLDLAGLASFPAITAHLSRVAEVVIGRALAAARASLPTAPDLDFAILTLGKLAGRELTYHSDLDLIFLYSGDTEKVQDASRLAQRFIHYLSAATGAGRAYEIDTRLRPSGGQGALVIGYDAFRRYQLQQAQTWEHLALMRCRAVAGNLVRAEALVREVQHAVRTRAGSPWDDVATLRQRIATERARDSKKRIAFKTGAGGTMDVDFLAAGAQLEAGALADTPDLPAVPALLASVVSGAQVERVIESYHLLRVLEARVRLVAGRPVEDLDGEGPALAVVAELVEPGLAPEALLDQLNDVRASVRAACERVLSAGSISALAGADSLPPR